MYYVQRYDLATSLYDNGQFEKSADIFKKLLHNDSSSSSSDTCDEQQRYECLLGYARCLYQLHALSDAQSHYERALRINDSDDRVHYECGVTLSQLHRFEDAAQCLQVALYDDDGNAPIEYYYEYGVVLQALHDEETALTYFQKCYQLQTDYKDVTDRIEALSDLSPYHDGNARECAPFIESDEDPNVLAEINKCLYLSDYRAAQQLFATLFESDERTAENFECVYKYAQVLHKLSEFNEAEKYFKIALSLRPEFAACYFNLGRICERTHRNEEALMYLEKAAAMQPSNDQFRQNYNALVQSLHQRQQVDDTCTPFGNAQSTFGALMTECSLGDLFRHANYSVTAAAPTGPGEPAHDDEGHLLSDAVAVTTTNVKSHTADTNTDSLDVDVDSMVLNSKPISFSESFNSYLFADSTPSQSFDIVCKHDHRHMVVHHHHHHHMASFLGHDTPTAATNTTNTRTTTNPNNNNNHTNELDIERDMTVMTSYDQEKASFPPINLSEIADDIFREVSDPRDLVKCHSAESAPTDAMYGYPAEASLQSDDDNDEEEEEEHYNAAQTAPNSVNEEKTVEETQYQSYCEEQRRAQFRQFLQDKVQFTKQHFDQYFRRFVKEGLADIRMLSYLDTSTLTNLGMSKPHQMLLLSKIENFKREQQIFQSMCIPNAYYSKLSDYGICTVESFCKHFTNKQDLQLIMDNNQSAIDKLWSQIQMYQSQYIRVDPSSLEGYN